MKILFITNIPSPYRVDFFNLWGQIPDVHLTVIFLETPEEHKGRSKKWFHTDYTYFKPVFLHEKVTIRNHIIYKDIFHWLKEKYDGIIFGGYAEPTYMAAMEYLRIHHIPYGIEVDGGLVNNDSLPKLLMKKHFLSSAEFWFSSGNVASNYLIHYGADPDKIIVYPFSSMMKEDLKNALEFAYDCDSGEAEWRKNREECREKAREFLKIKEPIMNLFVGRFIKEKGFDLLIDLLPQLNQSMGYYFIGGQANDKINNFIKEHKLKNAHLLDFKSPKELAVYFRAADLFILPTKHDVWGLVVSEAMAYGLPIVTTDLCGAGLELVEEGKNGVICRAGDKSSLKSSLDKIMRMDLNHLGFESYRKIQNYTIENMALTHYEYFKSQHS